MKRTGSARSAGATPAELSRRARRVHRALAAAYPDARCALDHTGPFTLLVATVLSAQTTDARVNTVTPELFARWPGPAELAAADPGRLRAVLTPLGMAETKTRYLRGLAAALCERHGGEVPADRAALEALPGVGRKTAHVVLGNAFGASALTVDTHVARTTTRLGWTVASAPRAIEQDVVALLDGEDLTMLSHRLIAHGRACCTARSPHCAECPVLADCPTGSAR